MTILNVVMLVVEKSQYIQTGPEDIVLSTSREPIIADTQDALMRFRIIALICIAMNINFVIEVELIIGATV